MIKRFRTLRWTASACLLVFMLFVLSGCSHRIPGSEKRALEILQLTDDMSPFSWTTNAAVLYLKKRPYLALDAPLMADIRYQLQEQADSLTDEVLEEFIRRATELANTTRINSIAGIPINNKRSRVYFSDSNLSEHEKSITEAEQSLAAIEKLAVAQLKTNQQYQSYLEALLNDVEPSIKTRGRTRRKILGAPLAPFLYGWMAWHTLSDDRGPMNAKFEQYQIYEPGAAEDSATLQNLKKAKADQLLALYSPRIIQQKESADSAQKKYNQPGAIVLLKDKKGDPEVSVDTSQPTVYGYVAYASISGQRLQQLIYTVWYSEHARLGRFDPEAGKMDGAVLRITLDANNRPWIYETMLACGCYHKVYPSRALERKVQEKSGQTEHDKFSTLIKKKRWRIDVTVPQTAGDFDPADPHPTLWILSGGHQIARVSSVRPDELDGKTVTALNLKPYADLQTLSFGQIRASMFDRNGLVRGADRPEATFLSPTGIFHAGTPRQRGTQLTAFDQYDFDDPWLLERLLQLP